MMKRLVASLLAVVLTLACGLCTAVAATEMLHPIKSVKDSGGAFYRNTLGSTGITFLSSAALEQSVAGAVKLTLPANCKLSDNGKVRTDGTLSADKASRSYVIDTIGSHQLRVQGPESGGVIPYAVTSVSILSAANTRYVSNEIIPTESLREQNRTSVMRTGGSYEHNFANGATINYAAIIYLNGPVTATLSRNGKAAVPYTGGTYIKEPGSYQLNLESKNAMFNSSDSAKLTFVIKEIEQVQLAGVDYRYSSGYKDSLAVDLNLDSSVIETVYMEKGDPIKPPTKEEAEISQVPLLPEYSPLIFTPGEPSDSDNLWGNVSDSTDSGYINVETGGPPDSYINEEGRTVSGVTIQETYHADFDTYEQEFAGKYFYTNVSNGSITADAVIIDIPAGIAVTMDKDGVAAEFKNKMPITAYGSYSLRLVTVGEDGGEYVGRFRFRLQSMPNLPQTDGTTGIDGTTLPGQGTTITPPAGTANDGGVTDSMIDEITKPIETPPADSGATVPGESFDPARKLFLQTVDSGYSFYSSVPNGAVVSGAVSLVFDKEPESIAVTRNDEPMEYTVGSPFTESGIYCVRVNKDGVLGGAGVDFNFRILGGKTRTPNIIYAPAGYTIASATLDEEKLTHSGERLLLESDGSYAVTMRSSAEGAPELALSLTRDTVAPEFRLGGVENGVSTGTQVTVEYLSEDIGTIELLRDGKPVERFGGSSITDPGSYQLKVYDEAGNCSTASFTLTYRMNLTSILAVLLIVLLIAAGVVFVLRTRKQIQVR